ncbi:MAG TPA: hypothetical protein ENK37_09745 [Oceanithermus profundus]|uniref:DMT family transporter n=1 Tax=Oceanithermus profundus TaxID=187137 RepID=A0A7C4V7F0_9DEIN|nr:hypothetical protein [Oceanithermus profundus]
MNAGFWAAAITGVLIAVLGPVNAALQARIGTWGMVAVVHLLGLAVGMLGLVLLDRTGFARTDASLRLLLFSGVVLALALLVWAFRYAPGQGVPPYAFLGGVLGALVVVGTIVAIQHLGVLAALITIVAGQLATAALIDRFGLFDLPVVLLSPARLLGLLLVLAGVFLVVRKG